MYPFTSIYLRQSIFHKDVLLIMLLLELRFAVILYDRFLVLTQSVLLGMKIGRMTDGLRQNTHDLLGVVLFFHF